jgi:hypothetical protein
MILYMTKPPINELSDYFKFYISKVKEDNLMQALIDQHQDFMTFLKFIPTSKEDFAYDTGKWTIKEVLQHIIDTERVFSYRALCFSRDNTVEQPGYEQDIYVSNSNVNNRTIQDLIQEFDIVRQSTILLYKSFSDAQLNTKSKAAGKESTPLIIGFMMVGHCTHHKLIMEEKYL